MKFCLSVILLFLFIDCSAQPYRSHFTKPDSPLYKTKLLHVNFEPSYKLNFLKSDLLYQRAKVLYPGNNFKQYVHNEELLAYCRDRILVDIQKTMQEEHKAFIDKDIQRMGNNIRRYERETQNTIRRYDKEIKSLNK